MPAERGNVIERVSCVVAVVIVTIATGVPAAHAQTMPDVAVTPSTGLVDGENVVPVGAIETEHERPWATVLRVPIADGNAWFKACAPVAGIRAAAHRGALRAVARPR